MFDLQEHDEVPESEEEQRNPPEKRRTLNH